MCVGSVYEWVCVDMYMYALVFVCPLALRPCKGWDQQLCARFQIPYERDCGKRFHYSDEEVGKII